jgi:hypothetical protein
MIAHPTEPFCRRARRIRRERYQRADRDLAEENGFCVLASSAVKFSGLWY